MSKTKNSLTNINMLNKEQYDAQEHPSKNEIWAVNIDSDQEFKEKIVGWGIPNGSAGIGISGTYTAPTNGLIVIITSGNGKYCSGSCGGISYNVGGNYSNYHEADTFACPIAKGKQCTMSGSYSAVFYPFFGG